MQQKEVILEGTIKAFNEKGLKFTMDDVAKILGMSKKTIYTVFRDKESMFLAMVDYMFDSIKESEQQIVEDKYPVIYKQVEKRLETGWETTIQLLEQGMAEGVVRKVSIPIVKMMLEATVEQFFQRDILIQSRLSYLEALDEVVSILVNGIVVPEAEG